MELVTMSDIVLGSRKRGRFRGVLSDKKSETSQQDVLVCSEEMGAPEVRCAYSGMSTRSIAGES